MKSLRHTIRTLLYTLCCGIAIGASNVIPGLSGGTLAVLLGIYPRLIAALTLSELKQHLRKHLLFLVLVAVGALCGVILLAGLVEMLLLNYPAPTYLFFIGLILGGLPRLISDYRQMSPRLGDSIWFLIGVAAVLCTHLFASPGAMREGGALVLIISGMLGAAAMVIPGISGSFILLMMGSYQHILSAVNQRDIITLLFFALGMLIGILSIAQLMRLFLKRASHQVWALVIALVAASAPSLFLVMYPSLTPFNLLPGAIAALAGFSLTFFVQRSTTPTTS